MEVGLYFFRQGLKTFLYQASGVNNQNSYIFQKLQKKYLFWFYVLLKDELSVIEFSTLKWNG